MKPKKLYFLEILTKGKLRYGQRGGGKFSSKDAMKDRKEMLERQGIKTEMYETKEIQWQRIEQ